MRTYFSDCKTVQEVKSEYRKLAMKFHPDRGGDEKIMTAINAAYKKALERVATSAQKENGYGTAEHLDDGYMAVINQIIALDGVKIELCGLWIWLSGETKKHKEAINFGSVDLKNGNVPTLFLYHLFGQLPVNLQYINFNS